MAKPWIPGAACFVRAVPVFTISCQWNLCQLAYKTEPSSRRGRVELSKLSSNFLYSFAFLLYIPFNVCFAIMLCRAPSLHCCIIIFFPFPIEALFGCALLVFLFI
jgi:hypothetical protein